MYVIVVCTIVVVLLCDHIYSRGYCDVIITEFFSVRMFDYVFLTLPLLL